MKREETFAVWAPEGVVWSRWAKPVLFARMPEEEIPDPALVAQWRSLEIAWAPPPSERTALVVDLPGRSAVLAGLALASRGYRPVPLYNGCAPPSGAAALVDVGPVLQALLHGTADLQQARLDPDAPPAFLLDCDRMPAQALAVPRSFDNRWLVFPQDFPSATFLLSRRIESVLVAQRGDSFASDLSHVLKRWQESGIGIRVKDPELQDPARDVVVPRPPRFRSAWYRALVLFRLRRNSAGGFGSIVPEPGRGTG